MLNLTNQKEDYLIGQIQIFKVKSDLTIHSSSSKHIPTNVSTSVCD